ncbi:MAG: C39 family peptidase [Planctomycetota bacterium]
MRYRRLMLVALAFLAIVALAAGLRTPAVGEHDATGETKEANQASTARCQDVLIRDVPHVCQKPDFCGEACAAMVLRKLGRPVDQDYVFDQSGLDPMLARGCHTKELAVALANVGFKVGPVWHKIPAARADESLESLWGKLHADLVAGIPSIVCTRYDQRPDTTEHFRLVLGFDAASDEVIYHEPAEPDGAYRRMDRATFLRLWPLEYDARQWTVILFRLEPGSLKAGTAATTFTAADYAQHMMKLRPKIPGPEFTVVIQPPFVVISDESPARVRQRAEGTIRWAADKLKEAYFPKDPAEILDIWLFRDKASYEKHTWEVFRDRPTTPFGYYSGANRALVMNIATGGGTLVHEIVHPFMAANFPGCPAWLNEGLGSLYEQSAEVDGRIHGLTNWRLAGLQEAIRDGRVPSFKTLCSTTDHQFYEEDRGTNYAQARYLCYYLQEHGLLQKFYHRFHANRAKDPTGYETLKETLKETLGRNQMDAFKTDWEAYVLKLRFRS